MTVILVLGADEALIADALARAGEDDVIVVDPSAKRLEALEASLRDPRLWFLLGDAEAVPLPDASVDEVVGPTTKDVERVLR